MKPVAFPILAAALFATIAAPHSHAAGGTPLVSGANIPVGASDGRGPLAAHAVVSEPVGAAFVYHGEQPDLFVKTGRFGKERGLFLYRWIATSDDGTPVFGRRHSVSFPFDREYPPTGTIFQTDDGVVHAIWLDRLDLVHTVYDPTRFSFDETGRVTLENLPRAPESLGVLLNDDGSLEVLLGISDGTPYKPTDFGGRDPQYRPYDGRGIWRGGLPYVSMYAVSLPALLEGPAGEPRLVSSTQREVRSRYHHIASVNLGEDRRGLITGSVFGGLHYYRNTAPHGVQLEPRQHVVGHDGIALRHPIVNPGPVAYPNPRPGLSDLIAGGEGALYYYHVTGEFTDQGKPIYDEPVCVLEQDADLYGGTLPVPNAVDWDGDGDQDIVCGNSEGRVLFIRNAGTNTAPAFLPGEEVTAAGRPIHVQPGYRLDIQGPNEARWGYTCPTVADWNGDGILDVLMSDSTARHTVFINRGAPKAPALDERRPVYYDGLDLFGTWRVKPAVARLGSRMAYVALDDDDQFHLYWQVDPYNVEDGGKLTLDDGSVIGANFIDAGGTGRLKLNLADWDRDGVVDLIVGTPRHGSVPNPENGLPQSLGLPGSAVLLLRNVRTNEEPAFAFPELMTFRGEPIFLGQHACGPAVADFGGENGPDLIVGEEDGRFIYYRREDLSHGRYRREDLSHTRP